MKTKIIILLFIPFILIGQEHKSEITWKSSIEFESSSLDKNFLNSLLFTGYITDSIKDHWLQSTEENNIINGEIRNQFMYSYKFKNHNIKLSVADINLINTHFTNDFLHLGFEGNFAHQDKTLNFSNTNLRANRFQQFKIIYGSFINNINLNIGCSYLLGNHHINYIINEGSLYTAPYGAYLDLEYDVNAFMTDTSNLTAFANNGEGVALDFSTNFNIMKHEIQFSLEDLGYIIWNPSSIALNIDSVFTFRGIEIEDIYNFNDSILDASNIIEDINNTKNTSFKSYIPAIIQFSIAKKLNYKYLYNYKAGVIAKWQPYMDNTLLSFDKIKQGIEESNFKPLYYIHSIIKTKKYDLIPRISYGGYTNTTNIGLALSKGKKNKLIIGTNHLEDIFAGDNAQNLSLYINIKLQF